MSDLSKSWGDLTNEEKSSIAMSLAGKNHMEVFEATLGNFNSALRANVVAQGAAGSAMKENAKYMDSIEGKVEALKSAWSRFSNSMIDSGMVKGVLSGLTVAVDALSSGFGAATIKTLALATAIGVLIKLLASLGAVAIGGYAKVGALLTGIITLGGKAVTAIKDIGIAFSVLRGAMMVPTAGASNLLKIFGLLQASGVGALGAISVAAIPVGIALGGIMTLVGKYYEANDKVIQQQKEATKYVKDWKDAQEDASKTQSKVKSLTKQIAQLQSKKQSGGLSKSEEQTLSVLQKELEVEREILQLQRQREQSSWQKKETNLGKQGLDARDFEEMAQHGWTAAQAWKEMYGVTTKAGVALVQYKKQSDEVSKAQEKLTQAEFELDQVRKKRGHTEDELIAAEKEVEKAQEAVNKAREGQLGTLDDMIKKQKEYQDYIDDGVELTEDQEKEFKRLSKAIALSGNDMQENIGILKDYGEEVGLIADKGGDINKIKLRTFSRSLLDAGKSAGEVLDYIKEIKESNPDAKVTIDGAEVADNQLEGILQYLEAVDSGDPDATVTIGGVEYAIDDLEIMNGQLQTVDGTVVTADITANDQDAQSKEQKWSGKKEIGTRTTKFKGDTKDVVSKWQTWHGRKEIGTRIVYFKGVKTGDWPIKHGTRNFQQGFAKGGVSSLFTNAEVNEQGFEIIQNSKTGMMRVANGGNRGATYLNRGDAVYTHGQSMRMLQKAGITEGQLLRGKRGNEDVGVYGIGKLEGFAKGKQGEYNKKVKKLREKYDKKITKIENKAEAQHWTDAQILDAEEAVYDEYIKALEKLNKKWRNKKVKLKTDLNNERLGELESMRGDVATDDIEEYIDGAIGTVADLNAALQMIKDASDHLSDDEIKDLQKEAYQSHLDYLEDMLDDEAISIDEFLAAVEDAYAKGMITAKEYYDYQRALVKRQQEILEEQAEAEKEAMEQAEERARELAEMAEEQEQARIDLEEEMREAAEEAKEAYHEAVLAQLDDNQSLFENQKYTYEQMLAEIQRYYNDAIISAEEYYDYINQLAEAQVGREQTQADRQWNYLSEYISRQIELESEENELLEAKNDLLSAQNKKVKVYVEGQGFVYRQDNDAVKEAQANLKSYTSVWQELQDMMSEAETITSLKNAGILAGTDLVSLVEGLGTGDTTTWSNLIAMLSANKGSYDLANELGITDPNQIRTTNMINGQTFNISNVSLPSVTDANQFVDELTNLATQAIQSNGSRT